MSNVAFYLFARKRCFIHIALDAAPQTVTYPFTVGERTIKILFSIFSPSLYCFFFPVNKKIYFFMWVHPRNDVHTRAPLFEKRLQGPEVFYGTDDRKNP